MTLVANIKGYINGNTWGVFESAPALLTYEQIITMANNEGNPWTNTIAELNRDAEGYYQSFVSTGNFGSSWGGMLGEIDENNSNSFKMYNFTIPGYDGTNGYYHGGGNYIQYNPSNNLWYVYYCTVGGKA